MKEICLTDIEYIEPNQQTDIPFRYKPDVPKLKLVGEILDSERDEEEVAIVYLTQNQLHKVIRNKEIDLKWDEVRWVPSKPITQEQMARMKMVDIYAEHLANVGDIRCFEVMEVKP